MQPDRLGDAVAGSATSGFAIPFVLDEKVGQSDVPLSYRPWGTRTIKVRVSSHTDMPRLWVRPLGVRPDEAALGITKAYADDCCSFHVTWGGGHERGPCLKTKDRLSAFETCAPFQADDVSYLYFNLTHAGAELPQSAAVTLRAFECLETNGKTIEQDHAKLCVRILPPPNLPPVEEIIRVVPGERDGTWTTSAGRFLPAYDSRWWPSPLDNSLLLLGSAGAGKTIALCELAQDLIQRANADERYPLPVILRLAPWRAAPRRTLPSWIDSQLKSQYGLGQTHIAELKARGLVLLLDGLDEVSREHRASCVKAINDYCADLGWINIVVSCRSNTYAELEHSGHGLTIPNQQVIALAPLETARIEKFLDQLDRVGMDVSPFYTLLEHERTPLTTDVILQTYEGKPEGYVDAVQVADVWENYVGRSDSATDFTDRTDGLMDSGRKDP